MKLRMAAVLMSVLMLGVWGCGPGALGDECDEAGGEDECEDGAACGKTTSGETICLKTCNEQEDCATNENCNGVTGDDGPKACFPK